MFFSAATLYVALVAIRAEGFAQPRGWLVGGFAVAFATYCAGRTSRSTRWLGTGLSLVIATFGAQAETSALVACGILGATGCVAVATCCISRIPSGSGVAPVTKISPAAGLAILAISTGAAVVAHVLPDTRRGGAIEFWTSHRGLWDAAEVLGNLGVVGILVEWTGLRRSLEIGMLERARGMRAAWMTTALLVAASGVVADVSPDRLSEVVVAAIGTVVAACARESDATRVSQVARRSVALALVGGAVALLSASIIATSRSTDVPVIALVAVALALAIGAGVSHIERPLRPERGVWLDACARANVSAWGDADDAVREALMTLRTPGGLSSASPSLWTVHPPEVVTVDAAGYVRRRESRLPDFIAALANAEPERTLPTHLLKSLEVRRPELRAAATWMSDEGALVCTAVGYDGEVDGVLMLPQAPRTVPFTLEEARALRGVTDRLAAACRVRSTLARTLARAEEARRRADQADARAELAQREVRVAEARRTLDTLGVAMSARPYSATSSLALDAIESRSRLDLPVALEVPSGVDPLPYIARAHLSGARKSGAIVVVDSTSARMHALSRWEDTNASPLALAHGGLLVLLDVGALPMTVQALIARSVGVGHAPGDTLIPLDVRLAMTAVCGPAELEAKGRLDSALALHFGDARFAPVRLPRLQERPEDLRTLIIEHVAREGLRVFGRPVGVERAALSRLIDHAFPGEDAELSAIVRRLVARCDGDIVRVADIDAAHPLVSDAVLKNDSVAAG